MYVNVAGGGGRGPGHCPGAAVQGQWATVRGPQSMGHTEWPHTGPLLSTHLLLQTYQSELAATAAMLTHHMGSPLPTRHSETGELQAQKTQHPHTSVQPPGGTLLSSGDHMLFDSPTMCACMCLCAFVCVPACLRVCVCACVCVYALPLCCSLTFQASQG